MAGRIVVLTRGPGRIAGEVRVEAPLPRPAGFRTWPVFTEAAEAISALLAKGAEAAP
jgi:NitT/TauT family transport system ATP-binding protein